MARLPFNPARAAVAQRPNQSPAGFKPTSLDGLYAWFDGTDTTTLFSDAGATPAIDAGAVGQWLDKGPYGWHLAQATGSSKPLWYKRMWGGSVRFSFLTAAQYLVNASFNLAQPNTVIVRHWFPQARYIASGITSFPLDNLLVGGDSAGPYNNIYFHQDVSPAEDDSIGLECYAGVVAGPYTGLSAIPHTAVVTFNGGSSRFRMDGLELVTTSPGTTSRSKLSLGAYADGSNPNYCFVSELIIYNRVLSDAEIVQVEAYCRSAYAGPAHTLLMFGGDSITRGSYCTPLEEYPSQVVRALTKECSFYNRGVPFQTIAQATATPEIDNYYSASNKRNVLVFFDGSNDLAIDGASLATMQSRIQNYCAARRATGWQKIILGTVLPRTGIEPARTNYNNWLAANYGSFADGLMDFAADPNIGPVGANNNTTYYADGTHPNATGAGVMASIALPVITANLP